MAEYRVTWEIDVSGQDPLDAACQALEIQRDPASQALTFTVTPTRPSGDPVSVYLPTGLAQRLGAEHGKAAASVVFDGNTPRETYERFRKGIEDGDPEVFDALPSPDLSGQWADGYTPELLAQECSVPQPENEAMAELCTAYEDSFTDAMITEVERMASYQLDDQNGAQT